MKAYWLLVLFFLGAEGFTITNEIMLDMPISGNYEILYRALLYVSLGSALVSVVSIMRARAIVQLKLRESTGLSNTD